jgi:hypothetical protein
VSTKLFNEWYRGVELCRRDADLRGDGAAVRRPINDLHLVDDQICGVVRAMPLLWPGLIPEREDRRPGRVNVGEQEDPAGVEDHRVEARCRRASGELSHLPTVRGSRPDITQRPTTPRLRIVSTRFESACA